MKKGQKKGERWGVWLTCPCGSIFYRCKSVAGRSRTCSKKCQYKFMPRAEDWELRHAFQSQLNSAKKRGIKFKLTYETWLKVWIDSGRLPERGRLTGQYCMARPGNKGNYEVGNVQIVTVGQNCAERNGDPRIREIFSRAQTGRKHSENTIAKMRAGRCGTNNAMFGKKHSVKTRKQMSVDRTGKKHSVQARANMVAAWKIRRIKLQARASK